MNNKIENVKAFRKASGSNLKDAHGIVGRLLDKGIVDIHENDFQHFNFEVMFQNLRKAGFNPIKMSAFDDMVDEDIKEIEFGGEYEYEREKEYDYDEDNTSTVLRDSTTIELKKIAKNAIDDGNFDAAIYILSTLKGY
jgi:hypothetical protein